jgi:uncharacterized short protein YbdD (DUF466 family)
MTQVEELADNVSNMKLDDVDINDYDKVLAHFKRNGLNMTRSQFSKLVKKKNSFECLKCRNVYDNYNELKQHIKRKNHLMSKEELQERLDEFVERIKKKYPDSDFTTLLNEEKFSDAEMSTFISISLDFAHRIKVFLKNP